MLVIEKKPKSIEAEAFRSLRSNVEYLALSKKHKVIIVTSFLEGEGKSVVAGNLALSLAKGYKKVLLIDFNMRRPSLHRKFNLSSINGISDYLTNRASFCDIVEKYTENLYIISAGIGADNPSEILSSNEVDLFLNNVKNEVDYVIIDTPPLKTSVDAQILSMKSDGVILVVNSNKTKSEELAEAIDKINKVDGKILGIVMNDVKEKKRKIFKHKKNKK